VNRRNFAWLAAACLLACAASAGAQVAPITRSARFIGNINFVATGGSLRSSATNTCTVNTTSTAAVSGIPAGSTITAAYLYWGGSGATVDSSVTLNGTAVAAGRTFTTTFSNGGTNFPYFGGFANVTSRVTGNANFTFGGLTVNTGSPHCDSSAVVAGWSLVVIYSRAAEPLRAINVFDGLQYFRGSSISLTPDGFRVPATGINGKMAVITWEGDPQNSTPLNGFSEELRFDNTVLNDGIVVAGSDPAQQPFDGTVNTLGVSTSYGVDVDTFDVSAMLQQGETSATTLYSAGGDLVLLTAQVVSATSEPVVDLRLTKTHTGNFNMGSNGSYTLRVTNGAVAMDSEISTVTVTDTLPTGFSYVSGTGTGWSCSAAGQAVTCTHAPPVAPGGSLPDLTLTVAVGTTALVNSVNTATVASGSYDADSSNNTATDATTVVPLNPTLSIAKASLAISDPVNGTTNPKRIPGGVVEYVITVANRGPGQVDASTIVLTDPVPANSALYVATTSGNPVVFADGTPASGLAYSYAANVTYSNQAGGGAPYTYVPVPDSAGFDAAVRGIRIAPTGSMNAAGASGNPSFTIRFRVRIN
jgi:uncharacterized repeat protein (TIGR01451 family)